MKILSVGLGFMLAVIIMTAGSTVHAQSGFDPQAEVKNIVDTYLMPASKDAQEAINLAASDPQKACQLAKQASQYVKDANQQVMALHNKLAQNGYDPSILQPFQDRVKAGAEQMAPLPDAICSGEIAKVQTDPETQAITQKIGGYMNAYTHDVLALLKAQETNDTATYCARARDGDKQLLGLSAYLVDLRKTTHFSPEELAGLDSLNTKIAGFKAGNDARLAKCKASP